MNYIYITSNRVKPYRDYSTQLHVELYAGIEEKKRIREARVGEASHRKYILPRFDSRITVKTAYY